MQRGYALRPSGRGNDRSARFADQCAGSTLLTGSRVDRDRAESNALRRRMTTGQLRPRTPFLRTAPVLAGLAILAACSSPSQRPVAPQTDPTVGALQTQVSALSAQLRASP